MSTNSSWSSISMTRHYEADIFRNKHSIEPEKGHGFDHDKMSEEEAIALAIKHEIPVIVKSGLKAKWYFKGKDVPHDTLMQMINDSEGKINSKGKRLHKNKHIILIKFN